MELSHESTKICENITSYPKIGTKKKLKCTLVKLLNILREVQQSSDCKDIELSFSEKTIGGITAHNKKTNFKSQILKGVNKEEWPFFADSSLKHARPFLNMSETWPISGMVPCEELPEDFDRLASYILGQIHKKNEMEENSHNKKK